MYRYNVHFEFMVIVEAKSEEEAIEKAKAMVTTGKVEINDIDEIFITRRDEK